MKRVVGWLGPGTRAGLRSGLELGNRPTEPQPGEPPHSSQTRFILDYGQPPSPEWAESSRGAAPGTEVGLLGETRSIAGAPPQPKVWVTSGNVQRVSVRVCLGLMGVNWEASTLSSHMALLPRRPVWPLQWLQASASPRLPCLTKQLRGRPALLKSETERRQEDGSDSFRHVGESLSVKHASWISRLSL